MNNVIKKHHQKENGIILTMTLLPILLACFFTFSGYHWFLYSHIQYSNLCRKHLIELQKQRKQKINQLMSLNPKATYLRTQKKKIKTLLLAATHNPALLSALQVKLKYIYIQQIKLQRRQKKILRESTLLTQNKLLLLQKHLPPPHHSKGKVGLAVLPRPISSISPNYHRQPFFTEKQKFSFHWLLSSQEIFPSWLQNQLPSVKHPSSCTSSLQKTALG